MLCYDYQWFIRNTNILKIYDMTKAFKLIFSAKALFFTCLDYKKRLPKLVRQSLSQYVVMKRLHVHTAVNLYYLTGDIA